MEEGHVVPRCPSSGSLSPGLPTVLPEPPDQLLKIDTIQSHLALVPPCPVKLAQRVANSITPVVHNTLVPQFQPVL